MIATTIYRYRARLDDIGTATAIAGHKRGWKSFASRLLLRQEEAVEQTIKLMRRKAGPLPLREASRISDNRVIVIVIVIVIEVNQFQHLWSYWLMVFMLR